MRYSKSFCIGISKLACQLLGGLLVVQPLSGCMGSSGNNDNAPVINRIPPPDPGPPDDPWLGGYYNGTATNVDGEHFVEALVLKDGTLRMTIGGSWQGTGSLQFVGHFQTDGDHADGDGIVIGQDCWNSTPSHFCGMAVPAVVGLTEPASSLEYDQRPVLSGDLTVTADEASDNWTLDLRLGARIGFFYSNLWRDMNGVYGDYSYDTSDLAAFGSDLVVNVDHLGQVFFQSAQTGCVGNGSLSLYGDGTSNILSASLLVENCGEDRASMNGALEGLASFFDGNGFGGPEISMYLSRPTGNDVPVALRTTWWTY